ncbi:MAG: magnesium/cobalt transporter CorA [Patescibacteria group bacterium]
MPSIQTDVFEWINISHPTQEVLTELAEKYAFHHLSVEDSLSQNQRPKIDEYDDYLFMVLHAPHEVKYKGEYEMKTDQIALFISKNFFVTLHEGNHVVNQLFQFCENDETHKEEYLGKGTGYFLYKFINELFLDMFPILDKLSVRADRFEEEIFVKKGQDDMLEDILELKKELLNFRRVILPQRPVIALLEHKAGRFLSEGLEAYFDDIVDKIERIWTNLESLNDLLNSIQQTNETIISHNTNNVMKILTIFSVIILPLTFLTGVYGMNLDTLPYASHEYSFYIVMGLMSLVAVIMLVYFKIKRWL